MRFCIFTLMKGVCRGSLIPVMRPFRFLSRSVLVLGLLANLGQADEVSRPPNILMICIDDLNDWVVFLGGHPDVKSPHLDALARRARHFTNAHCVVPVCSASRVSIMSGLHATTHGSYEFGPSYQSIPRLREVPCLQQYFRDHGYRTYAGGKVLHHGFRGSLQEAIEVRLGRAGGPRPPKTMNWPGGAWDWGAFPERDAQMFDDQLARKTAAVLAGQHDKPFFISVGFFRPHVPLLVPQKWFDLYDRDSLTLPKAPASDLADLPPNLRGRINVEPVHREVVEKGAWRGLVHAYLASISFVDHCVGLVMEGLAKGPHSDETLVVLWSDHGFHLGEKHQWAKRYLWEEATRVPFLIAGPGIEPGGCDEPVSLLDLYPTLVEKCGLPANESLDGLSLLPQLKDPAAPRERPVLTSSFFGNHAIRSKDWRYLRYADGAEELYDHRRDPDEFDNLATLPEYEKIKKSLARWLPTDPAPEVRRK